MVEDDLDIQAVARVALETLGGFTVKMCSRGREALEVGEAFQPDLILLDVMMPEMDGPSTLQRLKELPGVSSVPVVFITAKAGKEEQERFKAMGALDVIFKPFDPNTLSTTLLNLWRQSRQ